MSKRALGKGIGALIGESDEGRRQAAGAAAGGAIEVPLASLKPNPRQPRRSFRDETLRELADSIRSRGVLQPILVEQSGEAGYTVIAGERRVRAAKLAGLERVPVIVRALAADERLELALIENIQREDLTPIEEARAYRELIDARGLSQEEVARRVGKDRSTVANSLRLLKLPPPMQAAVERGELTAGHARAILSLVNPADQELLFKRVVEDGLSVREAEQQAAEAGRGRRHHAKHDGTSRVRHRDADVQAAEQQLIERFGTKVAIRGSAARGRIEISYYSSEDLERLLELLRGRR
jgi:ParB family chromosome partitioning protein